MQPRETSMRTVRSVLIAVVLGWLLAGSPHAAEPQSGKAQKIERQIPEDEKIWDYLMRHREEMIRITEKPYRVNWVGSALCARPNSIPHSPHGEHWIDVFVSPSGTNAMLTGKGTYPAGTIILKQKYFDARGTNTDFYTGMRKRERGYNPGLGDWEFFTLDSRFYMVTARGKIESCMDCHSKFDTTDFVSRRYLTTKEDEDR